MSENKPLSERVRANEFGDCTRDEWHRLPDEIAALAKQLAEAQARIAELEGELRAADGRAAFNSNLFAEQAHRIAELERELAEARHIRITAENPTDDAGVPYCNYDNCAVACLTKEQIVEARKDAERYRHIRTVGGIIAHWESGPLAGGRITNESYDEFVDQEIAAMRQEGE